MVRLLMIGVGCHGSGIRVVVMWEAMLVVISSGWSEHVQPFSKLNPAVLWVWTEDPRLTSRVGAYRGAMAGCTMVPLSHCGPFCHWCQSIILPRGWWHVVEIQEVEFIKTLTSWIQKLSSESNWVGEWRCRGGVHFDVPVAVHNPPSLSAASRSVLIDYKIVLVCA